MDRALKLHTKSEITLHPLIPHPKPDRDHTQTPPPVDPQLEMLRRWQSQRLARTHRDLLNHPDYGKACRFFLSDVYGPRDFTQRDEDLLQVYRTVKSLLPPPIADTFELVIMLNELTLNLDNRLLQALVEELDVTNAITPEVYAEAYRLCDNFADRVRQIDLIVAIGRDLNRLVHRPFVGLTLRMAHQPAHWLGWGDLQDFLEHGYNAFKNLADAEGFLHIIEEREKRILDQIYAGSADPFVI